MSADAAETGNAPVICRVPAAALAVGADELWDEAEHRSALVKKMLLDLSGGGWKYSREPGRDVR